jgi:hypothetical protein
VGGVATLDVLEEVGEHLDHHSCNRSCSTFSPGYFERTTTLMVEHTSTTEKRRDKHKMVGNSIYHLAILLVPLVTTQFSWFHWFHSVVMAIYGIGKITDQTDPRPLLCISVRCCC